MALSGIYRPAAYRLACTTTEDEKHILQVDANLVDYAICYLVDGVQVHQDKYETLSDLIDQDFLRWILTTSSAQEWTRYRRNR